MKRFIFLLTVIACCGGLWADDDSCQCKCAHCGCQACCHRVCHVVCELKDVKETCYSCRCEEICIPGRSCACGEVCECDPCKHQWCLFDCLIGRHDCETCRTVWQPSCEVEIRSRTKLIKTQITKKVPTYKWVVEYCCDDCCAAQAKCSADGSGQMQVSDAPPQASDFKPQASEAQQEPERLPVVSGGNVSSINLQPLGKLKTGELTFLERLQLESQGVQQASATMPATPTTPTAAPATGSTRIGLFK